jgi:hypothetical protein
MLEMVDTPLMTHHRSRWIHRFWVVLIAGGLVLAYTAWGKSATIPVGNAQGLDIQIDFRGYDKVSNEGAFAYHPGKTLRYQVIVTNKGNTTFTGLEVQSMIQGIKTRLPGEVVSPPHKTSLAPGQVFRFDVEYTAPPMKDAAQANLVINARYTQRGAYKSDSFLCPTRVRFE